VFIIINRRGKRCFRRRRFGKKPPNRLRNGRTPPLLLTHKTETDGSDWSRSQRSVRNGDQVGGSNRSRLSRDNNGRRKSGRAATAVSNARRTFEVFVRCDRNREHENAYLRARPWCPFGGVPPANDVASWDRRHVSRPALICGSRSSSLDTRARSTRLYLPSPSIRLSESHSIVYHLHACTPIRVGIA